MRYVQYDPFGGCWLWDSGVTKNDWLEYPIFTLRPGKQQRVNRFMYEHVHGLIPKGLIVRHTCDVTMCVNPAHLILGTHKDNAADREARHRGRRDTQPKRTHCAHGHEISGDNVKMLGRYPDCRTCHVNRNREYRARQRLTATP